MEQGRTINRLPVRTWNWLHMNECAMPDTAGMTAYDTDTADTPYIIEETGSGLWPEGFDKIEGGMGTEIDEEAGRAHAKAVLFQADSGEKKLVQLRISCEGKQAQTTALHAGEGSHLTVIMEYEAKGDDKAMLLTQTRLKVEKNATIRLIQIQRMPGGCTLLNDVGAVCGDRGRVELLQLFLGECDTYAAFNALLSGTDSSMETDIAYLCTGRQRLDMNYLADHRGPKSTSLIRVNGVLQDAAFKTFRGTIDFKQGARTAQGEETEDVLLMGESVVNRTIPLILCHEEDVQGNHGATIGRMDEEMLFYLSSRGLSEEEARRLLVAARLKALIHRIGDAAVETEAEAYLDERLGEGESI